MIYTISRTSNYGNDQPCEEAKKMLLAINDTRHCTEDYFNKRISKTEGLWLSKGVNHTITKDGYITRVIRAEEDWTIEIKTIEDLHNFIDRYGSIIITKALRNTNFFNIEIYDTYRE